MEHLEILCLKPEERYYGPVEISGFGLMATSVAATAFRRCGDSTARHGLACS